MNLNELREALSNEQRNFDSSLKEVLEKRVQLQKRLDELLGKKRTAYSPLTAEAEASKAVPISDTTYSELQRSLNRQKKLLSFYRKQFNKN